MSPRRRGLPSNRSAPNRRIVWDLRTPRRQQKVPWGVDSADAFALDKASCGWHDNLCGTQKQVFSVGLNQCRHLPLGSLVMSTAEVVRSQDSVTLDAVQAASKRIRRYVYRTPIVCNARLNERLGAQVKFKCENLQHVGAFKARGATNAVFSLSPETAAGGVVTHSSGNHAAALARAARLRGIPAQIVMPSNATKAKIANVRRFGVEPILCTPTLEARIAEVERVIEKTGATLIHPYNDPHVIAGQGTVGLEVIEQVPEIDILVAPVGGGGLLSGLLTVMKAQRPRVKVIAAEPAMADDVYRSLQSGVIEPATGLDTIADGLRTTLGSLTFPIIRELVDDILLVSEDAIREAVEVMRKDAKIDSEPSGAVPLAAVMEHPAVFSDSNVVAVVSGGNSDN